MRSIIAQQGSKGSWVLCRVTPSQPQNFAITGLIGIFSALPSICTHSADMTNWLWNLTKTFWGSYLIWGIVDCSSDQLNLAMIPLSLFTTPPLQRMFCQSITCVPTVNLPISNHSTYTGVSIPDIRQVLSRVIPSGVCCPVQNLPSTWEEVLSRIFLILMVSSTIMKIYLHKWVERGL